MYASLTPIEKSIVKHIKKGNLLLAYYSSHFLFYPEEAKNVARIFSTYFENNKLKQ